VERNSRSGEYILIIATQTLHEHLVVVSSFSHYGHRHTRRRNITAMNIGIRNEGGGDGPSPCPRRWSNLTRWRAHDSVIHIQQSTLYSICEHGRAIGTPRPFSGQLFLLFSGSTEMAEL